MSLGDILGRMFGGQAETDAANRDRQITQQYGDEAQRYLTGGYNTGVTNLNQAVSAYAPLASLRDQYAPATGLQLDALGVNGPAGTARAQTAMQATPGYAAGIEAVLRRRAGASMGDSGGTDQNLIDYAVKDVYQPWLAGVTDAAKTGGSYATTAAGGQAAGYGSLAQLAQQYAGSQAGVAGNVATGMTNASNLQGQGEASGARNLLNAGMSLAGMATNLFAPGMGTAISGLFAPSQNSNPWAIPMAGPNNTWGRPQVQYGMGY